MDLSSVDPLQHPLEVLAAGETDRGIKRSVNEDTILLRSDIGLFVVADGAGGHNAGNVASAVAATTVAKYFDASEASYRTRPEIDAFGLWTAARRLSAAVQKANTAVIEIARSHNKYRGMGTTIVCALFVPESGRLHIAHVGDSRAYRLRQGFLEQLTQDHTMLTDVVELRPDVDDKALAKLPRKAVTRAIGLEETVRVAVQTMRAVPGDRFLLCSDGLTRELRESLLAELMGQDARPDDIARELIDAAKDSGGRDNIAVVVVECLAGTGVRRRPSERERPAVRMDRPAGDDDPSIEITGESMGIDPEILLLRASEHDDELDDDELTNPRITAVPAQTVDDGMRQALDAARVAAPLTRCVQCGKHYETAGLYCPHCGWAQSSPLTRR